MARESFSFWFPSPMLTAQGAMNADHCSDHDKHVVPPFSPAFSHRLSLPLYLALSLSHPWPFTPLSLFHGCHL